MKEIKNQLVIIGGGPAGYTAAFRAADLGQKVILIDRNENLGGVCLNKGCIPSKTLLHIANILDETKKSKSYGVSFDDPEIDLEKIRSWKDSIIKRLALGIKSLAKKRNVEIINGSGKFINQNQIEVLEKNGEKTLISFEKAIIATGSSPATLPFIPKEPRIMDSTDALNLSEIPNKMLVIGGGAIGLEMATIYSSFGSAVTIVELTDQLAPGIDKEIIEPFKKYNEEKFNKILLETKVTKVEPKDDGVWITFENQEPIKFDKVLVAAGRTPNTQELSLDAANIDTDQKGFVVTNKNMQTNIENIFAIGDVRGNPMLAHKAIAEGKFVAEFIIEIRSIDHKMTIPSVIYADPEIATVGLSEESAQKENIPFKTATFPWIANGRSISIGRKEGITKLIFNSDSKKIIGGAIVGPNAGELISEVVTAISCELTAEKISHIIHPHPTLSETIGVASEIFLEKATDFKN